MTIWQFELFEKCSKWVFSFIFCKSKSDRDMANAYARIIGYKYVSLHIKSFRLHSRMHGKKWRVKALKKNRCWSQSDNLSFSKHFTLILPPKRMPERKCRPICWQLWWQSLRMVWLLVALFHCPKIVKRKLCDFTKIILNVSHYHDLLPTTIPPAKQKKKKKKVPNPRETIYRGGVSIWLWTSIPFAAHYIVFNMRFFLSRSFAQLPLFIRHFFSIRTFSVLFIYSLRSFEQQKTASMHNRTELDVICCCFATAFIRIQTCRRIHEFWCVFYFLSLSLRVAHNKESVLGWCWAWHCSCAIKCYANN